MNDIFICTKRLNNEINPPHLIDETGYCVFCNTSERALEVAFEDTVNRARGDDYDEPPQPYEP